MADELKIHGLEETLAALRALPTALSGKNGGPIRAALFATAKPFKATAQQRVRRKTGELHDNIVIRRDRNPAASGATERYTITVRGGRRKYANTKLNRRLQRVGKRYQDVWNANKARWLEFGTERMPAYPFMRPAFEANKNAAVTNFADALRARVAAAVALAKRGGAG